MGIIVLKAGHSLILGHKPEKLKLEQVSKKISMERNEITSLGLFDSSSPNYTTYYPDVKAEDLKPEESDFIMPVFRMLSETILSKGYPIDFSKEGVLKASMPLMLGQTINVDHETALGNAIGSVSEVYWQDSYKSKSGKTIPAGFNATLKIDGKSNPRIARGIMMEPPSIHSNSVTVRFKWEPSHTYEDQNEFYNKLGTYEKDGSLVRLVVTAIKQYSETSLVPHGADPYAQLLDSNGKIVNPDYADNVYNFSADKPIKHYSVFDYGNFDTINLNSNTIPIPLNNKDNKDNKNNNNMDLKEFLSSLSTDVGLEKDALTEENFSEKYNEAILIGKVEKTKLDDLQTKVDDLQTEFDALKEATKDYDSVKAMSVKFKAIKEKQVTEVTRLYKLIKGEKADDTVISSFSDASDELLESYISDYKEQVNSLFPDTCKKCGSNEISKASSFKSKTGDPKEHTNSEVKSKILSERKRKSVALGYK